MVFERFSLAYDKLFGYKTLNLNNDCPSRNDLESYFNGSLSAHNLELISQHILGCEKCVSILETIEATVPKPQIPNLTRTNAFGEFSPKILKKVLDMGGYLPEKTQSLVDRVLAAKQLGRKAIGIEIERKYCDIAIERLRQQAFDFEASE